MVASKACFFNTTNLIYMVIANVLFFQDQLLWPHYFFLLTLDLRQYEKWVITVRKRVFEIIEVAKDQDTASVVYDILMMLSIIISIIPLAFKKSNILFHYTDIVTTIIFIIDYVLRLLTADFKLGKKGILSFLKYPFTPWAIIDLISILPVLTILSVCSLRGLCEPSARFGGSLYEACYFVAGYRRTSIKPRVRPRRRQTKQNIASARRFRW